MNYLHSTPEEVARSSDGIHNGDREGWGLAMQRTTSHILIKSQVELATVSMLRPHN